MADSERNIDLWGNPDLFYRYKLGRELTCGVVQEQITEAILPYIPSSGLVIEFGAGSGALYDMIEGSLPRNTRWLETDQIPYFMKLDRSRRPEQALVELPNIPLDDNSADATVALSVFDTLSPSVLEGSLEEISRVLNDGGRFVHVIDLAPNTDFLVREAADNGQIALPCSLENEDGGTSESGLAYADRKRLKTVLQLLDVPDEIKKVLQTFIDEYEVANVYSQIVHPQLTDYLVTTLEHYGLITKKISLWDHFSEQLTAAASQAGLKTVESSVKEATRAVSSLQLPEDFRVASQIERRFGIPSAKAHDRPDKNNLTVIRSNILVHAFRKPRNIPETSVPEPLAV